MLLFFDRFWLGCDTDLNLTIHSQGKGGIEDMKKHFVERDFCLGYIKFPDQTSGIILFTNKMTTPEQIARGNVLANESKGVFVVFFLFFFFLKKTKFISNSILKIIIIIIITV